MSRSPLFPIYRVLTTLLMPVALTHHLLRSRKRGRPTSFRERLYLFSPSPPPPQRPVILIHAVSVGEAMAARPLTEAIKGDLPGSFLVMTTGTETGQEIARTIPGLDQLLYFPFVDHAAAVKRMYDILSPRIVIVMETELWPNLFGEAKGRGIPLIIANGRISDRSFPRYRRFSPLFRPVLSLVDRFLMQSPLDAERIIALGADPARVEIAGNLKYDIPLIYTDDGEQQRIRRTWHLSPDTHLLLFASTHRGEEEMIASALSLLDRTTPRSILVVPRHPERGEEAGIPFRTEGFEPVLLSRWGDRRDPLRENEVLIVDRIGVLMELYRVATLAFVGGSLVPHGGHNLLEPASCGVPILHGPHLHNFRDMARLFAERRGSITVTDSSSLTSAVTNLLTSSDLRSAMGERGRVIVADNRGALDRHRSVIRQLLGVEP
ncbi:MAG: 3-deoxy-D-manno-octulosonic acid transferase [Desulfuromonadia bacterium]